MSRHPTNQLSFHLLPALQLHWWLFQIYFTHSRWVQSTPNMPSSTNPFGQVVSILNVSFRWHVHCYGLQSLQGAFGFSLHNLLFHIPKVITLMGNFFISYTLDTKVTKYKAIILVNIKFVFVKYTWNLLDQSWCTLYSSTDTLDWGGQQNTWPCNLALERGINSCIVH